MSPPAAALLPPQVAQVLRSLADEVERSGEVRADVAALVAEERRRRGRELFAQLRDDARDDGFDALGSDAVDHLVDEEIAAHRAERRAAGR
jgi:hypothetical protein